MAIPLNISIGTETALSTPCNLIALAWIVPPRIVSAGTGIAVISGSSILLSGIVVHSRRRTATVAPARRPTGGRTPNRSGIHTASATDKLEIIVIPQVGTTGIVVVALQGPKFRGISVVVAVALAVGRGLVSRLRRAVRVGVLITTAVAGRGPVIGRTVPLAGRAHGISGTEGIEVRCLEPAGR